MTKRLLNLLTALIMTVSLAGVLPAVMVRAVCSGDIVGNGLGGIYINVRSAPYTTFANNGFKPYQRGGCGWFASARAYELTGKCKTTWNGQGWWNRGTNYGYTKGQTAKAKALICWTGHVAVLEKIDGNTAYISEGGSGYGTAASGYTVIRTVSASAISSMNSGFLGYVYLGVDGGSSSGGSSSIWGNDYMNLGSDFYAYIINSKHWKHLTNDGDNVSIRKETGAANQVWHFKYDSDGYYKIYNCKDGKALDVNGSSADSGTNVKVYDDHITAAQLWRIYGNNIAYYLKPKCSDCILDISNNSSEDGTNVQIWVKNNSDAQIFSIWKKNTPGKSTLSCTTKCSTVNFSWSKTSDTTLYNLRIFKNGTDYSSKWNLTTTNASVELPAGTYKAYIDSSNNYSYTKSNEVTVTVSGNHNYTSKVTTQATCTTNGVKTYTCTICGKSYTETIKATGHNYENGSCKVCGAKDPNYSKPTASSISVILADNVGSQLGTQTLKITKDGQYTILADGLNCVAGDTAITISSKGARDIISGNSKITIDKILINGVSYSVPNAWSNASPWGYEGTVNDIDVSPWNPWWKNNSISLNDDTIINSIQITFTLNYTELIENTTDPHLMFSTRVVKLDLAGENSQTVNITAEGDLPNKFTIEFICYSQVQCKWGEWDGNKISLNIIGKSTGNNQVIINLYDLESYNLGKKEILYNSVINVTVQCSHKYEKQIVNPTCTEQGYTEYKCSICGEVYNDDYTYPTGHEYTSKVTREPTCLLDGIKEYNCTRCGNTYTETIEATGHNYEDGTCTECGEIDNGEILEYDDEGNLVNYSDGYGNIQRWSYYSDGSIKTEYFYSTDDDYWYQYTYDENGNGTYYEDSDGYWENHEYDENGNETYYENSDGYWENHEYDENDDQIYYEDSDGNSYTSTYKYTYYNNGDVKSRYRADSDNWWVETTYTYHKNGEVNTEYSEYSDGTWVKTTYDEYGAVLSEEDGTISDDPTNNPTANPSQNLTNAPTASPNTKSPTTKSTQTTTKLNNTATVTKPAKVKSVNLKAKKKKLNVKWKKVSGATGYEVKAATNSKFTKGKKTVTVKKNKVTIKNLKPKKKYFVKVRAYKTINGNTSYGKWSKTVKVKVK